MVGQLEPLFYQLTKWKIFINSICHIKKKTTAAARRRLVVRPGWVLHKARGRTYLVMQKVSLSVQCPSPNVWGYGGQLHGNWDSIMSVDQEAPGRR